MAVTRGARQLHRKGSATVLTLLRGAARLTHRLVMLALGLGLLAIAAALALSWRLSLGPLEVDWAARRIEAAANTPGEPSRLAIGHAALRWSGFALGSESGVELHLADMVLSDLKGEKVAKAGTLDLTISTQRLLLGQVVPRHIALSGLEMHLQRDVAGDVTLDLGGLDLNDDTPDAATTTATQPDPVRAPTLAETLAELARPARRPGYPDGLRPARPDLQHIELLESVSIADSTLLMRAAGLSGLATLDIASLSLRRMPGGGIRGTAGATLSLGAARATAALVADLAPEGGTEMRLILDPINASQVQADAPQLATADTLDAAVQGAATLRLDPALHPTQATLRLQAGAGRLRLAGTAIGFDNLLLDAAAAWSLPGWTLPQHLELAQARAVIRAPSGAWPTTLNLAATVDTTPTRLHGSVDAALDHLAFADIGALWPQRLGGHIRPWLVPNVTAGTARDGTLSMRFDAAPNLADIVVQDVHGSLRGEDVTIWWIRPIPPVEGAQALLTINRPDFLDITIASARQGTMALKDGLVHITGLEEKDQLMALGASVQANAPELIALLRHPRLQLLDRKPIPMRNPAGAVTGRLTVNMMLKDKIAFEDVHIQATTRATGLHLGGLVAGRDLDRGDIQLEASSDSLHASGAATIAGIASDIAVDMDFRPGGPAQLVQRAQASGRATRAQLAAAGLDPGGVMPSGEGQFTANYAQRRDGAAELRVAADLRAATLALAGWQKPPGQPAEASATVLLRGDTLQGVDALRAQGPGLALEGRLEMAGGHPSTLTMDRILLGRTQAHGQLHFPVAANEPIRATLNGPVLDLAPQLARKDPSAATQGPSGATPWVADVTFDRVLLAAALSDRGLAGLVAHAEHDGRRLATVSARTTGPERVKLALEPTGNARHLRLSSDDGGALLRAADLLDTLNGGRLSVDASYDDTKPETPLSGTAELDRFQVQNARVLGKLLQAVTIYGVLDALSGPGLSFSKLVLPFRWDGAMLDVKDVQAFSASLGLTARGRIDTDRKTIALQGTVVPLYIFNSLLGRIPLLGRLFSSESGGGLVAVDYTMRGPLSDPQVIVNPLSALTPGFLRGLFHILD